MYVDIVMFLIGIKKIFFFFLSYYDRYQEGVGKRYLLITKGVGQLYEI